MSDSDVNPLVFVRNIESHSMVSVVDWLPMMRISPGFLADAPEIETTITVRVQNGVRRYRVVKCLSTGDLIAELDPEVRSTPLIPRDPDTTIREG